MTLELAWMLSASARGARNDEPVRSRHTQWAHAPDLRRQSWYRFSFGIPVNSLWPRATITTDAAENLLGGSDSISRSRTVEIMADAAHAILTDPDPARTGHLLIDENVLRDIGVTDFGVYAAGDPEGPVDEDFFLKPLVSAGGNK